jgi:tRNA(Ile)-lysidine synthase
MIKLACHIPVKVAVAVSGGRDSMACLDFLRNGKKEITALHFNHGTSHAEYAQSVVEEYCSKWNIPLLIGKIGGNPQRGQSMEDFWRKQRYEWFESTGQDTIVTCHHLDDAIEWWIMTSLKGNPKLIPVSRDKFIRPFLLTTRSDFESWAIRKGVQWAEDPSNRDTDYDRNYIRHTMMPHVLRINPGIQKTLAKLIEGRDVRPR